MADINQQTEELARIMEQVNREMAAYGQITKTTADQKRDAEIQAATGLSNFTKASGTAADAVGHLASAGMSAGKAMLEGKKGAAAFNESIDGLTKAATAAGVALTLLVPGGVIIKGLVAGFTAVTAATAGMVKASNEMADKIYKGYSGLAKSGAAASDGMTGVFNDAKKLGLSMNELDSFVGLVGENAGDLALFAGSVFEGRQKFAEMGEAMEPFREGLMKAGYTQQEINDASMQYLRLQTRVGQSQNLTATQLAEGAKKYLVEQDALTKLTGMSRQEQEKALEVGRSQQRFRAKLEEMRNSGDKQQIAAADEMEVTYKMLYKRSAEAAQGYGDMTTGMLGTEAAMKLNQSSQGEALVLLDKQKAGMVNGIQAFEGIGKAVGRTTKEFNMMYQTGVGEDFLLKIKEGADLGYAANKDLSAEYNKVREDMKKQGIEGGEAADKITGQYAKNITQQQKLNAKMEQTVFDGIDNALEITNKLGNVTDVLATGFDKLGKAVNKLLKIIGLGAEETPEEKEKVETDKKQDQKNWESASFTEKMQSSLARGLENAARGAGNLVGSKSLVGLADAAQQQRVESESKYLKEKGKFQQVQPAGGGRGSAAPTSPSGAPAASAAPGGPPPAAPAGGGAAPTTAPTRSLTPPPPSAGVPDGQPGPAAPAGQTQGGGNGSLRIGPNADMSGLDTEMMSRLEQFAKASGKPVEVTSAFRSDKKQAELFVRGHILKEPGIHMPAAPKDDQEVNYKGKTYQVKGSGRGSLHGVGNAVDIAGMEDKRGPVDHLLTSVGLFRPFIKGDPPHVQMLAEGGIVQPTPGGTPAIIGEGGNSEAVIPLKGNRIPVDFPEEVKRFFQFQAQVDNLKFLKGDTGKDTYEDVDAVVAASQVKMFAKLENMKTELMAKGWDRGILENYGEEAKPSGPKTEADVEDLESRFKDDTVAESIKHNVEQTRTLIDLISELVREQRNANDISSRILQVSSN
jgi:hypothetical protein